jgi:hypothetical protein
MDHRTSRMAVRSIRDLAAFLVLSLLKTVQVYLFINTVVQPTVSSSSDSNVTQVTVSTTEVLMLLTNAQT